jgi:mannose-1-phosphate guanylyltransferase
VSDTNVLTQPLWVVILAGGVGSRFWPLSTPDRPKQLLPLVNDAPLLVNTVDRLTALVAPERTLILTNASIRDEIAAAVPRIPAENILVEPRPAGTAAALAWAAREISRRSGPDAVMVCVHADWSIGDAAAFRQALFDAATVAIAYRNLVTVGIVPTRPDPGFGYISPGPMVEKNVFRVERFVEKPDRVRAAQMCADGYLWNSGIFAWRVGDFLREVQALTPEVAPALALDGDTAFFAAITTPISVDVGVLERSKRVLVLPGRFGWDDVGTWGALIRVRPRDGDGNAVHGEVHARDARNNVVHAEGTTVVLYGVSDLVVVSRPGLTLVTTIERSADLKTLIDSLGKT